MQRTWKAAVLVVAGVWTAACGENAFVTGVLSTGANLAGRWNYNAQNVAGSGRSCNVIGVVVTIDQKGSTFTGNVTGGSVSCTEGGEVVLEYPLLDDVIANGRINGSTVSFDIGGPEVHHTGSVSGNSLTGQLTIQADSSVNAPRLIGPYTMTR